MEIRNRKRVSVIHRNAAAKRQNILNLSRALTPEQITELNANESQNDNLNGNTTATEDLYKQLMELEEQEGVIFNTELIYCEICQVFVDTFEAICVRNCLHYVCIDCIRQKIIAANRIEVKCPINACEYNLQDREIRSLLTQQEYGNHMNKIIEENNAQMYDELVNMEQQSALINNAEPFECEICFNDVDTLDGIMIRECLHQFCIDCVRNTIINCNEAVVQCPATDCAGCIQDREVRSLLTQAEFDKYSDKLLRIAESTTQNSYHCKKPNCDGWCIVEDIVNTFTCPRCSSENCLTCRAIHAGKNCKEYQDELRYGNLNDDERTEMAMDDIVKKGDGMRCTTCKIVIMKREGCDFLICSMCKTELCWATKGSRWGILGRGDTSGGCRCSIAKKCHKDCRNCH